MKTINVALTVYHSGEEGALEICAGFAARRSFEPREPHVPFTVGTSHIAQDVADGHPPAEDGLPDAGHIVSRC